MFKVSKFSSALNAALLFLMKIEVTVLCASSFGKIQTILEKGNRKGVWQLWRFAFRKPFSWLFSSWYHYCYYCSKFINEKGSSYFHKLKFILLNYLKSLLSLLSLNDPVMYFTIEAEIRKPELSVLFQKNVSCSE